MGAAWRSPSALRVALNVIAVTFTNHLSGQVWMATYIMQFGQIADPHYLDQFRSRYLRFPQCKGVLHPSPNRWEMAGWVPPSIVSKSCSLRCWRLPTEPGWGGTSPDPSSYSPVILFSFGFMKNCSWNLNLWDCMKKLLRLVCNNQWASHNMLWKEQSHAWPTAISVQEIKNESIQLCAFLWICGLQR